MAFQRDENEIGALWVKQGAKGEYMTGECNGQPIVCFPITAKHERSPAWRILKSKPREQRVKDDDVPF